jgi:hypothetical protein
MLKHIFIFILFICSYSVDAQPLLMQDEVMVQRVKQGIDAMYNFEFDRSARIFSELRPRYGQHPAYSMVQALQLSWQYMPIQHYPDRFKEYKDLINQGIVHAENMLNESDHSPEAIFFNLSLHSMLALLEAEQKEYLRSVGSARKAYAHMRKGFDLKEKYPEFYFTTGLYNYYRVQYPASYPVYKPFMAFFSDGNKALGLAQLKKARREAVFTGVEATMFLSSILLRYEAKPLQALPYAENLSNKYPSNNLFKVLYTEALLAAGKYEQAMPLVASLHSLNTPFYKLCVNLFEGVLQERYYKNDIQAKAFYEKALTFRKTDNRQSDNYTGLIHSGLARIAVRGGDNSRAKTHYNKALELCKYATVKEEAKQVLR